MKGEVKGGGEQDKVNSLSGHIRLSHQQQRQIPLDRQGASKHRTTEKRRDGETRI